jgi:hypothetical protein
LKCDPHQGAIVFDKREGHLSAVSSSIG